MQAIISANQIHACVCVCEDLYVRTTVKEKVVAVKYAKIQLAEIIHFLMASQHALARMNKLRE